ncbi:MAG: patatin-like phospholipase family protein [Sphingobacteriaceae bacterium]|nr:MAG: patatin-like phospholipase family protein [Sphingobacteriaceae bacterium]
MKKTHEMIDEDLKQYEVILLSGCACIGASHLGFLLALQNAKKLRFLRILCGTSIGSIIGLLFLLKLDIKQIFDSFAHHRMIDLLNLQSADIAKRDVGLANTDFVIAHMIDVLLGFGKNPDITFEQLYDSNPITFVVTASKRHSQSYVGEYFSRDTNPQMKVLDAINASICIPLLFKSVQFEGADYIDGALVDNLPFRYVYERYKIPFELMLGHSPVGVDRKVEKNAKTTNTHNWLDILFSLFKFTRTELEKYKSMPDRTIFTLIEGASLNMETDEQMSLYYFSFSHFLRFPF